jgi:hypothetical protein
MQRHNNSSLLVKLLRGEAEDNKNIIGEITCPIYDNVDASKLEKPEYQKDCVIIYPKNSLDDIFFELCKEHNRVFKHRGNDYISETIYKTVEAVGENMDYSIKIMADPNCINAYKYIDESGDKSISYKDVQELCKKYSIPFTNQSYNAFVVQLAKNIKSTKPRRIKLSKEQKNNIITEQKSKCNLCGVNLNGIIREFDHKIPIAQGGADAVENIQCICIA